MESEHVRRTHVDAEVVVLLDPEDNAIGMNIENAAKIRAGPAVRWNDLGFLNPFGAVVPKDIR